MNITHAERETVTGDRLEAMFARQHKLAEQYTPIEEKSGCRHTTDIPVNIDTIRGQAQLKDYAWRITEELGEAIDAQESGDLVHYAEELIDALHFAIELTICAGYTPTDLWEITKNINVKMDKPPSDDWDLLESISHCHVEGVKYESLITPIIRELGMTMNTLKQKLWKQTHQITDIKEFKERLTRFWIVLIQLLQSVFEEDSLNSVVDVYLRKSQVNSFRIRSNY
jgi:hypothetical protein